MVSTSLFSVNRELTVFFCFQEVVLHFADKLSQHSLCLLMLLQFRTASITLCDQTDTLKWDHMLILGFREVGSVLVSAPVLFQDTRKHDLILRNSTWSKSPLVTAQTLPLNRILHIGLPFSAIPLWVPLSKVNTCLTLCTLSKALLGSKTCQAQRLFLGRKTCWPTLLRNTLEMWDQHWKHRQLNCIYRPAPVSVTWKLPACSPWGDRPLPSTLPICHEDNLPTNAAGVD